jgi:hypothetical protein
MQNKNIMKNILLILIFEILCLSLNAQITFNKSSLNTETRRVLLLSEADKFYQEGYYEKCINNLHEALKNIRLSKGEKEHAMELLAKAYIETEKPVKTDSVVNKMLIRFPHYELRESDNPEGYNRAVKKYKVRPLITIGARNTGKWLFYKSDKIYSVLDGIDYGAPYENVGYGFMYYGWGEVELDNDISLNGDLSFFWARFNRYFKKPPGFDLHYWETDEFFTLPLYVKKYFHIGKNVLPYVTGGMSWLYMYKADGNAYIKYTKDDIVTGKNADYSNSLNNINMLGMRTKSTYNWLAGAGVGYKLKNLRLFFDVRYYGGIKSLTNPSKRLDNPTLINDFFYIDNSVKLNQFEVGVSISYTLLNSVKKKK